MYVYMVVNQYLVLFLAQYTRFEALGTFVYWCCCFNPFSVLGQYFKPIENASFMPRVLATACIHSIIKPVAVAVNSFAMVTIFDFRFLVVGLRVMIC